MALGTLLGVNSASYASVAPTTITGAHTLEFDEQLAEVPPGDGKLTRAHDVLGVAGVLFVTNLSEAHRIAHTAKGTLTVVVTLTGGGGTTSYAFLNAIFGAPRGSVGSPEDAKGQGANLIAVPFRADSMTPT